MDRRSLAQELRRWVTEEMGFPPHRAPSEDLLQRLFIGQCADIWKYVIRHVRSRRTVDNIEGNLLWYQQLQHSEAQRSAAEEEYRRRQQLYEQIDELRNELQNLQRQVQINERDIFLQDLSNYKSQDFQRRTLLLQAYNKKRGEECDALHENNQRIKHRCDQLQNIHRASQLEAVLPALSADPARNTFPEPQILRDVREACLMRFKFLRSLHDDAISGSLLSGGEDLRNLAHQQWMSIAEKVWSSYPPNHVLAALEHLTLETTRDIRQLQASLLVDPMETSSDLSGTHCDPHTTRENLEAIGRARPQHEAAQPEFLGALPSFSKLLEGGWVEAKRVTDDLSSVDKELQMLSTHLANKIQAVHRTLSDGSEISALSRAAFDAEVRLVVLRGCRDALLQDCRTLQVEVTDKQHEVNLLLEQQQNVKESCLTLEKKQRQIQLLVKGNFSSKSQIRRGSGEVQRFVQEKLLLRPQELIVEATKLHDSVMKDVKLLSATCLPILQTVSTDGRTLLPIQELSINRLSDPYYPYYDMYRRIYSSVALAVQRAPEFTLHHVAEIKRQQRLLQFQHYGRHQTIAEVQQRYQESQTPDVCTLLQFLNAHYAQQVDQLVPKLQRLIHQCEKSQEYGKEVQASISDWWEQPAQLCLPWEERGGQTLRQWQDRWTVAVTALQRASGGRG